MKNNKDAERLVLTSQFSGSYIFSIEWSLKKLSGWPTSLLWWDSHLSGHLVSRKRFFSLQSDKTSANWKLMCTASALGSIWGPGSDTCAENPDPQQPPSQFSPAASMQPATSLLMLQRRPSCLINCREIVCASGKGVVGACVQKLLPLFGSVPFH